MKTAWWIEWPYAAWITVALVLLTVLSLSLHAHAEEPGPQESHPQSDGPPGLFIKIAPPARQLIAAEVSGLPADRTLTLTSLQGIVNQTEPRIFLVEGGFARLWLDWLVTRGDIDGVRYVPAAQTEALIEEFKDELRGQVVVDPRVPATLNLATMIAALDRLLITYPDYAEHYAERYGLPIVTDLRGLFNRNGEAYRWALDNLWPRLNHHALALLHPDVPHPRDFIIQQKIWVWWQGGTADSGGLANRLAELTVTYDVLKAAPVNIPVLGYPWKGEGVGLGEHGGVDLLSRYGKFLVPSDLARNLSVHANTRPPARAALQNEAPDSPSPSEPDPDKVYLTVIVSDGDNVQALLNYFPRYFEEPEGRTAPVAWTISPAAWDLIPDVVDYYAARRLPGDAFIAAVSGIGYVYLDRYGADLPNKDEAVRGFFAADLRLHGPHGPYDALAHGTGRARTPKRPGSVRGRNRKPAGTVSRLRPKGTDLRTGHLHVGSKGAHGAGLPRDGWRDAPGPQHTDGAGGRAPAGFRPRLRPKLEREPGRPSSVGCATGGWIRDRFAGAVSGFVSALTIVPGKRWTISA